MKFKLHTTTCAKAIAALSLGISATLAFADEGTFSLGTGFNYSSGTYGTATRTNITSIPVIGKYETETWTFKLTVPYVRISGGTGVIPGMGSVGHGPGGGASTVSSAGLGDVVAAASYNVFYDAASSFGADLTGKVKFGTANRDKGLGTGENDYSVQVDLYKGFGKYSVLGGVGYNVLGSSESIPLNNVYNITAGMTYKIDDRMTSGLNFDARERVSATAYPMREVTAFVSNKLGSHAKAQLYVLKGLADGSPDWGAGASLAYAF